MRQLRLLLVSVLSAWNNRKLLFTTALRLVFGIFIGTLTGLSLRFEYESEVAPFDPG